jgi:plasmid maintenance system antidote protein VapI
MRFFEFLNKKGISFSLCARQLGLSRHTVEALYYKKRKRLYADIALKIMEYSEGEVTLEDICLDLKDARKPKENKPKEKNPE